MTTPTNRAMSAQIYNLGRERRLHKPTPLRMPESLLIVAETFGFELPSKFTGFYLRRCKEGTEVHIKSGRLTLNLSYYAKTYPATFKAARQWINAVAERHGWELTETAQMAIGLRPRLN